jgi:uncharacterized protein (TIGR02246 family)
VDLAELADQAAISAVLTRYATALDARDWALLDTVFTEDAVGEYGGRVAGRYVGRAAIVALVRGALTGLTASQHILANPRVRLDGDVASSRVELHAQHYLPGRTRGGSTFEVGGTYHDRLLRTPDGWRITHRRLEVSWTKGNIGVQLRND